MIQPSRSSGYSLIELLIVAALVAVVGGKATMVCRQASEAVSQSSQALVLEDQARLVVDRIVYTLLGAEQQSLNPPLTAAPLHAPDLSFRVSLGTEDGEIIWDDPEAISFVEDGARSQVIWFKNPGLAGEQRVVWSNLVRDLLEGEEVNGIDDNGNELVDEEGLSFVIDGSRITVRLSLGSTTGNVADTRSVETTISCRNR